MNDLALPESWAVADRFLIEFKRAYPYHFRAQANVEFLLRDFLTSDDPETLDLHEDVVELLQQPTSLEQRLWTFLELTCP